MTPRQIELVQTSWKQVLPMAGPAAALFYGRLFELDPTLKSLFTTDLTEQGQKLMQMIGLAVNGLDDLETLLPAVEKLGRRHLGYGVRNHHYPTVGGALLWTLEKGLGPQFNLEIKEAWAAVYGLLAATMQKAALEMKTEATPGQAPVSTG